MKKRLLWLVLFCPLVLSAQQILDIGIFNNPVNSDKLEVRIRPTQGVNNGLYSAGVFTVRFLSTYGVTLSAPAALNNPLFRYALADQGTDGTYSYYSFAFVQAFTVNWSSGTEYPVAIIQINPGCGSGNGTFEIINNAWTAANNANVYQELDGNEAQNIIYQPTATAPLGMGMMDTTPPTITCTPDTASATNFNSCFYTHQGASWDAIGNDNCPGFIIEYILSGATIDTLYTLDNATFNKGLTTIDVTITDGAGLTANCSFTVTIQDAQPPVLTAPSALTVAANTLSCMAAGVNLGSPLATDNCPGVQVTNNAPASFPLGNTTVTWTATDAAGLSATATQTVAVQSSLSANAINLSSHQLCSGDTAALSFDITGGVGPYTVVYSANGTPSTVTGYASNKPLAVSPALGTRYRAVSITDSLGCSVAASSLTDSLTVFQKPTLSSLVPSAASVCVGESVAFTANGLLPNDTTHFQFTLIPGGPGTQTGLSTASGTFSFDGAIHGPGTYGMVINAITVNGCTTNFSTGNAGSYTVNPFPTLSGIAPSASLVCEGTMVHIVAYGLPPNISLAIHYTLNGVPGAETVLTNGAGTANLLSAVYPAGMYTVTINSVAYAGCSINTNQSTSFSVDPFQAICGFTVAGRLATETNKGVEEVKVTIAGSSMSVPYSYFDITDTSGSYQFVNTIPLASNYSIFPLKNDNPLNGVTTFDLVLISKHILSVQPLDSPYKMIAADANKSNSITSFDIVELRKLILGIYSELPNNTSWRFIDKYYVFPDTNNPFVPQFPVVIARNDLQSNALNEDFVAVKIGDLNGSVALDFQAGELDRNLKKTLWFDLLPSGLRDLNHVQPGEIFKVSFVPATPSAGYQFTLELKDLEVLDISTGEGMSADHFGVFRDAVTCSFISENPSQTGAFTITFRAAKQGVLDQMIQISSRITSAEAYSPDLQEDMEVNARLVGPKETDHSFQLFQNQPNPFSGKTRIPFYLPVADEVRLTIFDEFGSVIYAHENYFTAGHNAFELEAKALPGVGMFYCKVENSTGAALKKMVRN